ncbi:MAG: serine/threonine protein kinase [Gemmataceae bacterium]|nr:serine/threonine protein kinase [Gemmataceae bacterium]
MSAVIRESRSSPSPGSPYAPTPAELACWLSAVGRDLGSRYEMLGYLGHGAYATVWKARDRVTKELVAVKRFETKSGQAGGFYRELNALFRLRHPRIVRIVNLLEAPAGPRYLILEHCGGGSLRGALQSAVRTSDLGMLSRTRMVARQVAEGLAEAHRLGLAHRDLKPENVLFETTASDGATVKLADFGLARALQSAGLAAQSGAPLAGLSGTPAYMAPEQFEGVFAAATDVYALGVILYELLHGQPPFEGSPEQLAYQHLRQSPVISAALPHPWRSLLATLLDKDPERRPTAGDLLARLEAIPVARTIPPKLPTKPVVRSVPASTLVVFAESTAPSAGFIALSAEALFRFDQHGTPDGKPILLQRLTQVEQAADDRLWLVQGSRVSVFDGAAGYREVLRMDERIAAIAPHGSERIALVVGGELAEFALTGAAFRRCWSKPLRVHGLPPTLARLSDGRVACAEGPINPCLVVFDWDGVPTVRLPLPGPCWQLRPWPTTSRLLATLLIGNGLQDQVIDVDAGTIAPLDAGRDTILVAAGCDGRLHGLRSGGEMMRWHPSGRVAGTWPLTLGEAAPRAFAVAGERLALLRRRGETCWLEFLGPFREEDVHA